MNIIFGMPTLLELDNLEKNIDLCKELNLQFIELNMNLPEYQPDVIDIEKLIYYKNKYGIDFTIHLPEEIDIANFNCDIRQAHINVIKKTIDIAKRVDMPIINMHMNLGVYFTLPDKRVYLYEKYYRQYQESINLFKTIINDNLFESDIKVAIENTGVFDKGFISKQVTNLIQSPNIILTWDIGHDYSDGLYKDKDFILNNLEKLGHMHIHDAIGKKDHLTLYSGVIDINHNLEIARKTKSRCVIETKTVEALIQSVDNLKLKGFKY